VPAREAQGDKAAAPVELYNLAGDIGETRNVAAANPQVVREMTAMLEGIRTSGRSRR
jgi:hypothetical protein